MDPEVQGVLTLSSLRAIPETKNVDLISKNAQFAFVLSKSQSLKMLHERHLYRVFSADEDPEFDSAYSVSLSL
ncbi:hypothetical protein ACSBR1_007357 [Camellia fascicularis]